MSIKENIVFGLIITGIFGLLASLILLTPIIPLLLNPLDTIDKIQIIFRLIAFTCFLIGLFIGGYRFNKNYEKNYPKEVNNEII